MNPLSKAAALSLCSVLICIHAAHAGGVAPRTEVYFGDLNLSQPSGAQALLERLEGAATRVCGGRPIHRDLRVWDEYRACTKEAVDRAVKDVNQPALFALYGQPQQRLAIK
jgi:UrcA family protein